MTLFKSSATAEKPPVALPPRCEACRRLGVPLNPVKIPDFGRVEVCVDPASCRRHWSLECADA